MSGETPKDPSIFKFIWFFVFGLFTPGMTLAVSFSCSSTAMNSLHFMLVRPATLIQRGSRHCGARNSTITHGNEDPAFDNGKQQEEFSKEDLDSGVDRVPAWYSFGILEYVGSGLPERNKTPQPHASAAFHKFRPFWTPCSRTPNSTTVRDNRTRVLTPAKAGIEKGVMLCKRLITVAAGLLITSILWVISR